MLIVKNRVLDLVIGLEVGVNDYLFKLFYKKELLVWIKIYINIKKFCIEKVYIC